MKILLLAGRCALEYVATSGPRDVPMYGANGSGTCGMVNSTGLCWVDFPQTISFDYRNIPGAGTATLYLWRDLGRGSKRTNLSRLRLNGQGLCSQILPDRL